MRKEDYIFTVQLSEDKNYLVEYTNFQGFIHLTQVDTPITPRALSLTLFRTSPANFALGNLQKNFTAQTKRNLYFIADR